MSKDYRETKQNPKSTVYESDDYKVTVPDNDRYTFKNHRNKDYTDDSAEIGEMVPMVSITIENKNTKNKSQKRIFQDTGTALDDFFRDAQKDTNHKSKSQFSSVFKKIDEQDTTKKQSK